jgi:hypothetical protein
VVGVIVLLGDRYMFDTDVDEENEDINGHFILVNS